MVFMVEHYVNSKDSQYQESVKALFKIRNKLSARVAYGKLVHVCVSILMSLDS